MAESAEHIALVELMQGWVADKYFSGERAYIRVDHPSSISSNKPPSIEGFVPDLYAKSGIEQTIIGEAKTLNDIENTHTEQQMKAFIRHLGRKKESVLVFAAHWSMSRFAKVFLSRIKQQLGVLDVTIIVIEKLNN